MSVISNLWAYIYLQILYSYKDNYMFWFDGYKYFARTIYIQIKQTSIYDMYLDKKNTIISGTRYMFRLHKYKYFKYNFIDTIYFSLMESISA